MSQLYRNEHDYCVVTTCNYVIKKCDKILITNFDEMENWRFNSLFMDSPNYILRNFNLLGIQSRKSRKLVQQIL